MRVTILLLGLGAAVFAGVQAFVGFAMMSDGSAFWRAALTDGVILAPVLFVGAALVFGLPRVSAAVFALAAIFSAFRFSLGGTPLNLVWTAIPFLLFWGSIRSWLQRLEAPVGRI